MSLAELSIKRPVFISCIIILTLVVGYISLKKMPVNLFPDTEFPIVSVYTSYEGAAPREIEQQISKKLEKEISTIPNLKSVKSISSESISHVIAEFNIGTNIQDAKREIQDKLSLIKNKLPKDANEPIVRTVDPASQPIIILSLTGNMPANKLYDIIDDEIKNTIEQTEGVGLVKIMGGQKQIVSVNLDRNKLKKHNLSATSVVNQISLAGENIPLGNYNDLKEDVTYRTLGEYNTLDELKKAVVSFVGNDVPITLAEIADIDFSLKEKEYKTYINNKPSVFIFAYRQSGKNIIEVVDTITKQIPLLNNKLKRIDSSLELSLVRDDAKLIKANVRDVKETIIIGIILTIVVVYFFLGSIRSTIITGLALPNSLLGAFILMYIFGFSINVMSLLALSLAVGLLIDDAIVVRENIFRHIQLGTNPATASVHGTKEVTLAVIGTSLTILAVFGPVAFLYGIVGQFFKEFGLTICFAMIISLFDALTIAPMMSTYFSGKIKTKKEIKEEYSNQTRIKKILNSLVIFQDYLETKYIKILKFSIIHPIIVLSTSLFIFFASIYSISYLPKTFLPAQDHGEFNVTLELEAGTPLEKMDEISKKVTSVLQTIPEIDKITTIVGSEAANTTRFFISLLPDSKRDLNTTDIKKIVAEKLKPFDYAKPLVTDIDMVGVGLRPFNLNISGKNDAQLEKIANSVFNYLQKHEGLNGVEISTAHGKPELQVKLDHKKADILGISSSIMGQELRIQIDGATPTILKDNINDKEYDIVVKVQEDQRNLESNFQNIYIPNINQTLLKLSTFAELVKATSPTSIKRENKVKYIQISADINPDGKGMAKVMSDIENFLQNEIKMPPDITYSFVGQSESFQELIQNMIIALSLGILFIYLVLASLYESYIIPLTIMLVIPLAVIGAFFGLLITNHSLDLFSMIGCILLLGLATKNSILLVDYANQKLNQGYSRVDAIISAGQTRLRPILMTTVALIAGMIPVAVGINEASKQRTSMGIAIIGGLISSTILTLVVIPAAFIYIDKMRMWGRAKLKLDTIDKKI